MSQMQRTIRVFVRLLSVCVLLAVVQRMYALEPFPLELVVRETKTNLTSARKTTMTGLDQRDYLDVIAGIVNYFEHFQDANGRIIDPFLHKEFQYSTPCYAWAATTLVASGRQTNLVESAASALECSLNELAENRAAMNHGDFFMFPCMLAYENLRERVVPERRVKWEQLLQQIQPELCYNDVLREKRTQVHNWNIVALSGEFLRHQDGFSDGFFVAKYLSLQLTNFTRTGQYCDPNVPMAYDHFPRHFLAAMLERGYKGENCKDLEELLNRAAWMSLLMQSPIGELPTGGRSAQHQWNEAQQCVTYEIWAKRSRRAGDDVSAKAFKRSAHLALQSIKKWVRPSGELWIVKNRFDPAVRHGFQSYSSHSQYNLLAASMLSTAWLFADDSIGEGACPAELGGFAFELPAFHKIFANAGGLYLEIDTAADPSYNSTGLIRVHKAGVESLIGPSDSTAVNQDALAVGIAWREGENWKSLASLGSGQIKPVKFQLLEATPEVVKFSVRYEVGSVAARSVLERYEVTPEQVSVSTEVQGSTPGLQIRFPAFVFDGETVSEITIHDSQASVSLNGCKETFSVATPLDNPLHRSGAWIPCRNGFVQAIVAEVPGRNVAYTLRPRKIPIPIGNQPRR
jgi:hypothetical protein